MTALFIILAVIVVAAIFMMASGRLGATVSMDEVADVASPNLPDAPANVTPADIDSLRFAVGFRGYRVDQVDEVLDRLSATIASQQAELDLLSRKTPESEEIDQ